MIIDITKFKNQNISKIEINEELNINKEELKKTSIIDINSLKIQGDITCPSKDEYLLNVVISGDMILPDSITLEEVNYNFSTEIEGNIEELLEEIGESSKKTEFSIDIFPIIWENILMEIPIRIVNEKNENIKLEGDGWKLIDSYEKTSTNPELEKLKDLLK